MVGIEMQIICHVTWNWAAPSRAFCTLLTDGVDNSNADGLHPLFVVRAA